MDEKPTVGILTAFAGSDSAYSLVNVVQTQISMLLKGGYNPILFVSPSFQEGGFWQSSKFEIRKTLQPDAKCEDLLPVLREKITDIDVMICHDIVFLSQHGEWAKAVRQLAKEFPNITWLHWQHSRGDHIVEEPCENSYYCYPNQGDLAHVASMNKTTVDRVVYVPHPIDLAYFGWPDLALRIAEEHDYPFVDVSGILPTRLDRQKQVEKAVRLYAGIKKAGRSVCFICADAYATGDRFKAYKNDVLEIAHKEGLTDKEFVFLGEHYDECIYATPRPVVKALYEMGNLFILPSNAETSSLVAMEAAIAGNLLVLNADFYPILHLYKKALTLQFGSVLEDTKYYRNITTADGEITKVEDAQLYWDDQARLTVIPILEGQLNLMVKKQQFRDRWPSRVFSNYLEPLLKRVWRPRGLNVVTLEVKHTEPTDESVHIITEQEASEAATQPPPFQRGDPEVTAIICTIDNLEMLQRQLNILQKEVGRIIVVNNGSEDGTKEWLDANPDPIMQVIHRENKGAGPGRNAGLALWDENPTPYTLMLDGGILPPYKGVAAMKNFLLRHPEASSVSPEIATCYTTDEEEATLVYNQDDIDDKNIFPQKVLSGTAYCLCRADSWDKSRGLRFSEEGPFGEPGWGVDDNEMAYRWRDAGLVHYDFVQEQGMKLFRRASGSFQRLYKETGIWPNQFGSVYEKRLIKMYQDYPHYHNIMPEVSFVVLAWNEFPTVAKVVKILHDEFFEKDHEVIVVDNGSTDDIKRWIRNHQLRQHHGDATVDEDTGEIIRRTPENEEYWTGNFIPVILPENIGTGGGFNAGFAKARGKYIFYICGDMIPTKGSVMGMYKYMLAHEDIDYLCVNAWMNTTEESQCVYEEGTFDTLPIQGLGNYAYSYAIVKREVWDAGVRFATEGPFEGAGAGYEETEFANMMYSKGFKGYMFNYPYYLHARRDFERSGLEGRGENYGRDMRKRYLMTRWNKVGFAITHHLPQPPERHLRRIAVMNNLYENNPGPAGFLAMALRKIGCNVDQYNSRDSLEGVTRPDTLMHVSYDNYVFVDDGDLKHWACPEWAHPSAYWTIDMYNPSCFPYSPPEEYLPKLATFDRVFCTSPSAVQYCLDHELFATHLPHAANEDYHKPYPVDRTYSFVAVWSNYGDREMYAKAAIERYPDGLVTSGIWGNDYPETVSKGRCALSVARGFEYPARVVETMMIGTPLITRRDKYLDMFFIENEHYLGFDNVEEMLDKIDWVQNNPQEAQVMAQKARQLVLEKHRYYHRALTMFTGDLITGV